LVIFRVYVHLPDGKKKLGPRLEGKFIANCEFWAGCAAKQVWIGLDFDVLPKTVRCIRINQPVHEGFDEGRGF
jgi:hypothetical protein